MLYVYIQDVIYPLCFTPSVQQKGFELVESHDRHSVLAVVDYAVHTAAGDLPATSVYTAGPNQALFSLTLPNVYRQNDNSLTSDFTRIDGVPVMSLAFEDACTLDDGFVVDQIGSIMRIFQQENSFMRINLPCDSWPDRLASISWFGDLIM